MRFIFINGFSNTLFFLFLIGVPLESAYLLKRIYAYNKIVQRTAILIFLLISFCFGQVLNDTNIVRIGLALSGGGALGIAHIGVLKVLEQEQIPVSFIAGNSMGSLVGGLYSAGYSATQIESIALSVNWWSLFSAEVPFGARYLPERQQVQRYFLQLRHHNFIPILPSGLVPIQNVDFLLMRCLSQIEYDTYYNFDSLPIPYRAVAVDLASGKKVILKYGRLAQAIRASIAIPGVFAPKKIQDREYVDGGLIQNLPVDPLFEFNPDFIIASLTIRHTPETGISLIDIVSRSMDLVAIEDLNRQKEYADVLIEPNVEPFKHSDFFKAKELIKAGEEATRKVIPIIKEKLKGKKVIAQRNKITKRSMSIIRTIRIEGLKTTHKNIITHKLTIRKGTHLKFDQLINDLVRLFNTDFFEDVDYRVEFNADSVDVTIVLQEKAFGFYSFGLRYDNYDNIIMGLEVGQGNLSGSGANVRGAIHLGNPNEYRLGLTGTRLFLLPFGYRLDGFYRALHNSYFEDRVWSADYYTNLIGGVFEIGYILGRDAFFNIGFNSYKATYTKPSLSFFNNFPNREWIIGPLFRLEFNNFDNLYFPTQGITYRITGFSSLQKLNASTDFLKLRYFSEQAISFLPWLTLKPKLEIGISYGTLPLSEYFHSGAENLIGFKKDEFLTEQKLNIGTSADFRLFRLFSHQDYPFYFQVLANIVSFKKYDELITNFNFNRDCHFGAGFGIRTNTPIGPLQLILSFADLVKMPNNKINPNFSLSVGREFRY
ncbi:MAG: patatin-like phospholipase family protein [candidate division WOR-3 bacterium]|nr:patatin-like phospholipase family protein [candidate division WOR-3 bacterium]